MKERDKIITCEGRARNNPQIKSLDNIFRATQRLEKSCLDNQIDPLLTKLFENIAKCICSPSFIEIFIHSTTQENDNVGQRFPLHACTDYIHSHSADQQHKQCLLDIRRSLDRPFSQWLTQQSSSFPLWNHRMAAILRQLCFILTLSIQLNRYINLNKETFDYYCHLIESFVNILYSIIQIENTIHNKLALSLMGTLTSDLYTMTLSIQLEKYIKNKYVTLLMLKLANIENSFTNYNSTRYKKYKIIDDSNQALRFHNLLRCLKNLIQCDQVKDQLTKQMEFHYFFVV
ncbi:unnamed protein product [Rotaria magnacalcarata]|uniref:Uncharacterized protein n=1 Tax=Rotaria magnacalcarata TaxID=392030 RepID=A0A816ULP9_9BILA|nr:unnamed protein product [Rotaria magnacalcarata]CAF4292519.1 unnamed protein product [Rotaria magnacalcarata]